MVIGWPKCDRFFFCCGFVIADEYDHLDYTRAGSSFKQHYHRMDKPLNITVEESDLKQNNIPAGLNNLNAPTASVTSSGGAGASGTSAAAQLSLCLPSTSAAAATTVADATTSAAPPPSSASTSKTASTASTVSAASSPDDNTDVDEARLK